MNVPLNKDQFRNVFGERGRRSNKTAYDFDYMFSEHRKLLISSKCFTIARKKQ
jgi:hypothetical protein